METLAVPFSRDVGSRGRTGVLICLPDYILSTQILKNEGRMGEGGKILREYLRNLYKNTKMGETQGIFDKKNWKSQTHLGKLYLHDL